MLWWGGGGGGRGRRPEASSMEVCCQLPVLPLDRPVPQHVLSRRGAISFSSSSALFGCPNPRQLSQVGESPPGGGKGRLIGALRSPQGCSRGNEALLSGYCLCRASTGLLRGPSVVSEPVPLSSFSSPGCLWPCPELQWFT